MWDINPPAVALGFPSNCSTSSAVMPTRNGGSVGSMRSHTSTVTASTTTTSPTPTVDSPYHTEKQKVEIVATCYELLFVLADTVAQPLPDQQDLDKRGHAEEALRILDRAASSGKSALWKKTRPASRAPPPTLRRV